MPTHLDAIIIPYDDSAMEEGDKREDNGNIYEDGVIKEDMQEPVHMPKAGLRLKPNSQVPFEREQLQTNMMNVTQEQQNDIDSQVEKYFVHKNFMAPITHLVLVQYNINKGLKMFGKKGEEAITKELRQIHDLINLSQ